MTKLTSISTDDLVELFVDIAILQEYAMIENNSSKYNRLMDRMERIENELRSRDGDHRRTLQTLYTHDSAQVQLRSAIANLAIDPVKARKVLQSISDRNEYPQAADARGTMQALDEGIYRPE